MSGPSRPHTGCWTCRLRRKRCDGALPQCQNCTGLDITCDRSPTRPIWMDGGLREKEKTEAIKQQIKDGAVGRRQRPGRDQAASSGNSSTFIVTSQNDFVNASSNGESPPSYSQVFLSAPSTNTGPSQSTMEERVDITRHLMDGSLVPSSTAIEPPDTAADAWELDFVMIYMDHVFPYLFPFYQPPLVGTSRAWLLSFVKQNASVYHSVLSLSSFFFTVGHKEVFQDRLQLCRWTLWDQVSKRAKLSFEMIRKDIALLNNRDNPPSLLQKAQTMETVVQMLIFDQFIGGSDWNVHLTIAIDLFENIFYESFARDPNSPGIECILKRMSLPGPRVVATEKLLWNGYQAAFRFFTAILIQFDIMASTTFGGPPRLHEIHSNILGDLPLHEIGTPLNLAHFIGCDNWVLRTIGDIATLDAWKKEMERNQTLSQLELMERSKELFTTLQQGLDSTVSSQSHIRPTDTNSWHLQPFFRSKFQLTDHGLGEKSNLIWIYAARIYLSVISFGWNPHDLQIQNDVSEATALLKIIESPAQLHTLPWPICVIGCIAGTRPEQEIIDSIIGKADESQLMNSVREAGRIIKEVRASGVSHRDIASCLNVFGKPMLLV
ncbi:hypothetical protein N7478_007234 [Penicillium angulare]|uniref:uncharacterized protein n=1 Tax=Penicillium angulare TaxID=116970 RepID=UPI002541B654|nr:uncharacterized protein N7478_007234 [Penicillium angulare]KAJ5281862.1 hypothetical protein N7478_007234 [Penicillium angulare]